MARRDFLMTVITSVIVTLVVDRSADSLLSTAVADHQDRLVEIDVDRLIVRRELIVSDTGKAWEEGFEAQEIPRGAVIRSLSSPDSEQPTVAGIWVRSRLIKSEIDDPFDDRFHAIERDGTPFRAPGHISWNIWLNDAW